MCLSVRVLAFGAPHSRNKNDAGAAGHGVGRLEPRLGNAIYRPRQHEPGDEDPRSESGQLRCPANYPGRV